MARPVRHGCTPQTHRPLGPAPICPRGGGAPDLTSASRYATQLGRIEIAEHCVVVCREPPSFDFLDNSDFPLRCFQCEHIDRINRVDSNQDQLTQSKYCYIRRIYLTERARQECIRWERAAEIELHVR
jgi:hypothetical protein